MKGKTWILLAALVVFAALWWWSGRPSRRVVPGLSPTELNALSGQGAPAGELPGDHPAMETPLPTVASATLAVQGGGGEDLGSITLRPGVPAKLPGTTYTLALESFYTHWMWDGRAVNRSRDEENPAARVLVTADDSVHYHQWAFQRMPFFRHGGMGGVTGDEGELAFTLTGYKGLSFPEEESTTGETP